jgi:RNA polymerase sigma-70 factor (ECF subfamily)
MSNTPSVDTSGDHSGDRSSFETTQWSVVLAAGRENDTTRASAALEALCRKYWFPLFVYVQRRGYNAPDAQDLVQGFFARILERNDLQAVRRGQGRFRSYLCVALKNYIANEWKRGAAAKRGGGRVPIALEELIARAPEMPLPADERSPDRVFDQQWALALLDRVFTRLREEHHADGKSRQFECLQGFLVDHASSRSQADIGAELQMTESAVKQAVFRLRQRYQKLLRSEVADTVATLGEVEEEIRQLVTALRS